MIFFFFLIFVFIIILVVCVFIVFYWAFSFRLAGACSRGKVGKKKKENEVSKILHDPLDERDKERNIHRCIKGVMVEFPSATIIIIIIISLYIDADSFDGSFKDFERRRHFYHLAGETKAELRFRKLRSRY